MDTSPMRGSAGAYTQPVPATASQPGIQMSTGGGHPKPQKGRRATPGAPHPLSHAHLRPGALPAIPST